MPQKKYIVNLTEEQRLYLKKLISSGKNQAREINHARILLKADESDGNTGLTDSEISQELDVGRATVERVRQRFCLEGLKSGLERKKPTERIYKTKLDGVGEAKLIALSCGPPPEGASRWTLKLLSNKLVELEIADKISYETVRRVLKKK